MQTPARHKDEVRFRRPEHLAGTEVVAARYRDRVFPPHAHEEYVFGAITAGAERLSIHGTDHVVDRRRLILIAPGEVHSNRGLDGDCFAYSVIYAPAASVADAFADCTGRSTVALPRFASPAPAAPDLRARLLWTHATLMGSRDRLDQESAILAFLEMLFRTQCDGAAVRPAHPGTNEMKRARDYIEAHYRRGVSLRDLARMAGVSRFHFVRSFKEYVGLPPAAYQTHLRVAEAKRLIRDGCGLAEAAAEVGFADQSHLTRHFQRLVGTSPGRYAQQ